MGKGKPGICLRPQAEGGPAAALTNGLVNPTVVMISNLVLIIKAQNNGLCEHLNFTSFSLILHFYGGDLIFLSLLKAPACLQNTKEGCKFSALQNWSNAVRLFVQHYSCPLVNA